ncbi:hypothetical protein TNCV_15831 [Trichonephila clavipes]|nr:hypothetical protein TNCV_15831 [Trichonephila clavipes]
MLQVKQLGYETNQKNFQTQMQNDSTLSPVRHRASTQTTSFILVKFQCKNNCSLLENTRAGLLLIDKGLSSLASLAIHSIVQMEILLSELWKSMNTPLRTLLLLDGKCGPYGYRCL